MKILVATDDFFYDVVDLFHGHDVELLPEKVEKVNADLLVFTGGEDVLPSRYGELDPTHGWFNPERDDREFSIFQQYINGQISATKILGICRGHQLLNVALGGSLVYDIQSSYTYPHEGYHPLIWKAESPLSAIFSEVNSMHHQAIKRIGRGLRYDVLAVEPRTKLVEAIVWGDCILGVQFHPEFMTRHPSIENFKRIIEEWVSGQPLYKKSAPTLGSFFVEAF